MKSLHLRLTLGLSLTLALVLAFRAAAIASCPSVSHQDYVGYWNFLGEQAYMGKFEPPKRNVGYLFRDGLAYLYEDGRRTDSTNKYYFDPDGSLVHFVFRTCAKDILERTAKPLLAVGAFEREPLPKQP